MSEIRIISLGTKLPSWVNTAVDNYLTRIPKHQFTMDLIEIPTIKRTTTSNIKNILAQESQKTLDKIPAGFVHICLDRSGKHLSSEKLAKIMQTWLDDSQSAAITIGGPEGFPQSHLQTSHQVWSLSTLTLAHPVARVVLAEQLYRAWSIMSGHPYHRGENY